MLNFVVHGSAFQHEKQKYLIIQLQRLLKRQKHEARRGARTHNLEIKSLTRYRLCQPGLN